jgi:hypothetical protein
MTPKQFLEECKKLYRKATPKELAERIEWLNERYTDGDKKITPDTLDAFGKRVGDMYIYDEEAAHGDFDDLCWGLLRELGYKEGIDYVLKTVNATMWYA